MSIYDIRSVRSGLFMQQHVKTLSFLAIPVSAVIYWLFYRRQGYNYVEHLAANMYGNGFTLLVLALVLHPLGSVITGDYNSIASVGPGIIFQLVYLVIYYYNFIGSNTTSAKFKAFFAVLVSLFAWTFLIFALIALYISTGFFGMLN